MPESFIRTVLGDLPPTSLGACDAHEHVIIESGTTTERFPDFLLDDVERVTAELTAFRAAGGGWMVDTMPGSAGRNVYKLAAVSKASGVPVVACTGLHLAQYYPDAHPLLTTDMAHLAAFFVQEIENGAVGDEAPEDAEPIRAGVIKVAGGLDRLDEVQARAFDAAAAAHLATGCPIITHTEQGTAGMEQAEHFATRGVPLQKVTLSHVDRVPDLEYHRRLLDTGVNLEYDSGFRWKEGNPTVDLLAALLPQYPDQLMVGMDAARNSYWSSFGGGPGLAWLMTDLRTMLLEDGVEESLLTNLYETTPAKAFSFGRRAG